MKIVVTHTSPDMDAITSVWLLRKFLQGWEDAKVQFVPAGERLGQNHAKQYAESSINQIQRSSAFSSALFSEKGENQDPIESINGDEIIHVDTGLGPLDHHQTASDKVCGASLTFDFVKRVQSSKFNPSTTLRAGVQSSEKWRDRMEAVGRMVRVVVDTDHFKEVFWPDATSDYHEFSVGAVLDGLKLAKPNQAFGSETQARGDEYYVQFISECLDAILHEFENRIWAEKEIAENGHKFETRFGKGIGFETINDSVIKLAQKMGYVIVIRKDPRKGYVRIKARPSQGEVSKGTKVSKVPKGEKTVDLTLAYEKLRKMDPNATWFLHIGKKMLLNGSVKNPKMRPTRLGLGEIIKVLESI